MFTKFSESVLPYVMEHFYEEKLLCVASFGILTFYEVANCSNWLIVVVSSVSPGFNSSYRYDMRISGNIWSFFLMKMHHHIRQNQFPARWKHSTRKFYLIRLTHQTWLLPITTCLRGWATHLLSSALVRTNIKKKWLVE